MSEAPRPSEVGGQRLTRSELLRRAGVAAAAVAVGGGAAPSAFAGPMRHTHRELKGKLSIIQWNHVVPAYDLWFDNTWATGWGEANDVEVSVDHVDYTRLPALAAAEAHAQRGHDIFGFLSPPAAYQDSVIDHTSIVSQVEHEVGPYSELGRMSTHNPKTNTYFGVSDNYVPAPLIWRHDLWNAVGESPATWDHVATAAAKLKAQGNPIGIGQSNELDSNVALNAFLMCFGAFVQDEANTLTLDSKNTVQAVQFMADLYTGGEDDEIFTWNQASNNEFLFAGRGSLIINAISAIRTAEYLQLPFVNDLWLWPIPTGPHGRLGLGQATGVYSIWQFAKNKDAAEKFIADLCANYQQASIASQLFNFPSFPGAFPHKQLYQTAAADPNPPHGKYTILATIAAKYTHNIGYPGYSNAAIAEMLDRYLIPQMFARVSQGKATAAESVRVTAAQLKQIWAKWQTAGKI
jgi:multiple sugar transport system substrate-binding protein